MRQIPPRYRPIVVSALRAGAARWTKAAKRPSIAEKVRISWEANARYLTEAAEQVANPPEEKRIPGRKDGPKLATLRKWISAHPVATMDEVIDQAAKLDIQMSSLELRGWWTEESLNASPRKKSRAELEDTL